MSAPRARIGTLRLRLPAGAAPQDRAAAAALVQRLGADLAALSPGDWAALAADPARAARLAPGAPDLAAALVRALKAQGGRE